MELDNEIQVFQFQPKRTNKDMVHKKFKQYLKKNPKLRPIRIHDFRHSHVALLIHLSKGREEYDTIKECLRHSSITTTIDTYSHLYPNKQRSVSDPLDDIFKLSDF
ncbi:tyrosine-type recombinase/integrase [Isobaculum melis]|uniref:Phage integrase family protein n=1 Tax=Isobaculum melis TaxID=142588 RepID=A0A1H9U3G4_9LACT|nr:tyrosine-type recombinase/integrase [Isobaculum melis]SES04045.1 Phage integrase family protein [Isobaculum melis]